KRLTHSQQESMLKRSLEILQEVGTSRGNVVWLSAEPLSWDISELLEESKLDWCVIGAASDGPRYFQPDPAYVRDVLAVLDAQRTAVFFKGNLRASFDGRSSGPNLGRWREDFPWKLDGMPWPAVVQRQINCQRYGWTSAQGDYQSYFEKHEE